jgi:hypothetical protein
MYLPLKEHILVHTCCLYHTKSSSAESEENCTAQEVNTRMVHARPNLTKTTHHADKRRNSSYRPTTAERTKTLFGITKHSSTVATFFCYKNYKQKKDTTHYVLFFNFNAPLLYVGHSSQAYRTIDLEERDLFGAIDDKNRTTAVVPLILSGLQLFLTQIPLQHVVIRFNSPIEFFFLAARISSI